MKTLVLALLFLTACSADDPSTRMASSSSTSVMGSTSVIYSTSTISSSQTVMSPSASPSASVSPSASPSASISPSVSPSASMSSSASVSPSMSVSPSASSSDIPASSSKVPTTNPPTTNPTTTAPKPHYNVDVQVQDPNSGASCLWLKANINITYNTKNESGVISLNGKDAAPSGICSNLTKFNETSEVTLDWKKGKLTSMTVKFTAGSSNNWYVSLIGVVLNVPVPTKEPVRAEKTFKGDENTEFLHASQNKSYKCDISEQIPLESQQAVNVSLSIFDIMVQPFSHNNTLVDQKDTDSCSSKSKSSKSSSIVPIAVGCALAGLIVIVLIAYLIGRRKNDGRGYQQV